MDSESIRIYGQVRVSPHKYKTLMALKKKDGTPTQIGKEVGIRPTHVSKVLRFFKDNGIAYCINEEKRKNRIYRLTDFGRKIADCMEKN